MLGYSKLDLMFGHTTLDAVRLPYRNFVKPGVNFRQETITAIDPNSLRVTTKAGTYEADFVVIALGADYDMDATPGLAEGGNEFYSVAGAARLRDVRNYAHRASSCIRAARSCIVDSEAIACDANGLSVFDLLRYRRQDDAVTLCAFDLLELDGVDLRPEPIESSQAHPRGAIAAPATRNCLQPSFRR